MEDNEEEEDDDSYPMFPDYGDIAKGVVFHQKAMKTMKQKIKRHQMSLLMILVGLLLMQGETVKLKRKG